MDLSSLRAVLPGLIVRRCSLGPLVWTGKAIYFLTGARFRICRLARYPGNMQYEIEDKDTYTLVRCSGVLGGSTHDDADDALHRLIEDKHRRILFDLEKVDRITSQGIGVFVTLVSRANTKGCHVVFVNLSPFVAAVFQTTKIDKFLETADSLEAGLRCLQAADA